MVVYGGEIAPYIEMMAVEGWPGEDGTNGRRPRALVCTVPSDAHTWNLLYMRLLLEELGFSVRNLGPCTPEDHVVTAGMLLEPDLIVVSSVNGHGRQDGARLICRIREESVLAAIPVVIGGKLGTAGRRERDLELESVGFTAVFGESPSDMTDFCTLVKGVAIGVFSGSHDAAPSVEAVS